MKNKSKIGLRTWVQVGWTAITNGYANGFLQGEIYKGPMKQLCAPGLNCYSCPGALFSCPIGALQAVLGSRDYRFAFYVIGFLMAVGGFLGRFVCGWLCPFGLIQDLLYKIPVFKKQKNLPGHNGLRWLKYIILAVFVVALPLIVVDVVGQGAPWFCKYICPSGTLTAGYPLIILNEQLRQAIGWLFDWKSLLLILIVVLSIKVYRPFCKYLCPLGAMYGPFNKIAFLRYRIDRSSCTHCGACKKVCPMDIPVLDQPNSIECIRCGKCKKTCPESAIIGSWERETRQEKENL